MTKYFCFFSQKEYFLPHNSCVYAKKAVLLQPISSRDGGIGRHEGLKILWPVMAVRVQVPLAVLNGTNKANQVYLYAVL